MTDQSILFASLTALAGLWGVLFGWALRAWWVWPEEHDKRSDDAASFGHTHPMEW